MKFFTLLCLIGAAAASLSQNHGMPFNLPHNKAFEFEYTGRMLTGLPELAAHYSGIGIKCKVTVKTGNSQEVGIELSNIKYVRVSEKLSPGENPDSYNWRLLNLPPLTEVPQDQQTYLKHPIVFKILNDGEVEALLVDGEDPLWSINFKKAIVVMFQTKFQQTVMVPGVVNNEIIADNEPMIHYWVTHEESLDGTCEVTYQLNLLPKFLINEDEVILPYPQACEDPSVVYELIKSKDINSCSNRSLFSYYKPGYFHCPSGTCEGKWSRSSNTRYVTCKSKNGDGMVIQTITNEGEMQQNLLGYNTEKVHSGTMQTLKLTSVTDIETIIYPDHPTSVKIPYDFGFNQHQLSESQVEELEESGLLSNALPRNILATGGFSESRGQQMLDPSKVELKQQITELIRELIEEDLNNIQDISKKQISMKTLSLARAFSMLNKLDINELYEKLLQTYGNKGQLDIFKNIFFDTVIMGGSKPNVIFVKEKIETSEVSTLQTKSILSMLPEYVITPSRSLLRQLFELVTSEHIRKDFSLYSRAVLSYSTLIQKACLADNRDTSYPTYFFKKFCSPDSDIVVLKWIPYLQSQLHQTTDPATKKLMTIGLGLLGHKHVLPNLVSIIERDEDTLTRTMAIYGTIRVGHKYPSNVVTLLLAIYNNQAEQNELRIAAFNVILKLNPKMVVLQSIAFSTWREQNSEVLQVVNTAFFSLAHQQHKHMNEQFVNTLPYKANLAYQMVKRTSGSFPSSATLFQKNYLESLDVGTEKIVGWNNVRQNAVTSQSVYFRIAHLLDCYQFRPIEAGLNVRGLQNVVQQIVEILNPEEMSEEEESTYGPLSSQINSGLNSVFEKLGRHGQQTMRNQYDKTEFAFYLSLFENTPMFYYFKSTSSQAIRRQVQELINGLSQNQKKTYRYQNFFDLSPFEFGVPSEMGFPILVEVHNPVAISTEGEVEIIGLQENEPSVRLRSKLVFVAQLTGWVGTICPFTQETVMTGIDEHYVNAMPADIDIKLNIPQQKLAVNVKLPTKLQRPFEMLHFHVNPYTVFQSWKSIMPFTLNSNMTIIHSESKEKTRNWNMGQFLGLDLQTTLTTETEFLDPRAFLMKLSNFNYNPMNIINFPYATGALKGNGNPSVRKHEIQVMYNPQSSSTKEVNFEIQMTYGMRKSDQVTIYKLQHSEGGRSVLPIRFVPTSVEESSYVNGNRFGELKRKIAHSFEKAQVSTGQALAVRVFVSLIGGSRPKTFHYSAVLAGGFNSLYEKWSVHTQNEQTGQQFCMDGNVKFPSNFPTWDLEQIRSHNFRFRYQNLIGFGQTCQDSQIKVTGYTQVSDMQKEFSRSSEEAKLYSKIEHLQNGSDQEMHVKKMELLQKLRMQASYLDQVEFDIEYVNVPTQYQWMSKYFVDTLKSLLWPNIVYNRNPQQQYDNVNEKHVYRITINGRTRTFDMTVQLPQEQITFEHVQIPYPLNYIVPFVPVATSTGLRSIIGGSNTCTVEGNNVQTYNSDNIRLHLDNCYHLLSGDSSNNNFAVLVRQVEGEESNNGYVNKMLPYGQRISQEMTIFLHNNVILLTPRQSTYSPFEIFVNGNQTSLRQNQPQPIVNRQGQYICTLTLTSDNVVIVQNDYVTVRFNGYRTEIQPQQYLDQLTGICGNTINQGRFTGPRRCLYSKPELFSASFRIQDFSTVKCQSLPEQIQMELEKEREQCLQYESIPTKVMSSFKAQSGECLTHKHEIIERNSQLCFSRRPVPTCGSTCKPDGTSRKTVSFTCISKHRVAQHYAEKIRTGQVLPELLNLPESFEVEVKLPRTCTPVNHLF